MNLNIRKAEKDEIHELAELWYELASMHEYMMDGYELSDNPKVAWVNFIERNFDKKSMITFIAEDDDSIVGFVTVVIRERPDIFKNTKVGMILDLIVKEDKREEGVGSALVERSEEWIKSKGVSVGILTVAPENENAVDFWEKKGYRTYLLKKRKDL
uniref:Protein containing GCN5-related N-acetyltransferase domain protein n=1 Tax=uncultured organism TaxID=155900 RepID=M1Q2W0_9ZZZZ|nr:protein containing GCN5-related N-acetyltransferase domain protein [uncultured organism]